MQTRLKMTLMLSFFILIILSACSSGGATKDWKVFTIQSEPAIDIQFRLPPEWYVDYAPNVDVVGQWDVALVPPKCSQDQETTFEDNCVSLTIFVKGEADFDKDAYLSFISKDITLNQSGSEQTLLIGQNTFEVNGLSIKKINHKFQIGEEEVQMSFLFLETDTAYYTFVIELPYDERNSDTAKTFNQLIESIEIRQ